MADGNYITIASVRRTAGIDSDEISDTDVGAIIAECEPQIERFYNTSFIPKERIDVLDGNGTSRIFLDKNPVLSVRELRIDGETEDPANLNISKESGKIVLSSSATTSNFIAKEKAIAVKYLYGMLEESSTNTITNQTNTAGTDVELTVGSITDFSDDDWIEIYGMDGKKEVAQINAAPSGNTIQVDQLILSHESGSKVVKLQISEVFRKLMNIACAIAMVARIVGQSYTDTVGYGLGELNVQKGEPYTQWRETASQLIIERDMLMAAIKPRPCIR